MGPEAATFEPKKYLEGKDINKNTLIDKGEEIENVVNDIKDEKNKQALIDELKKPDIQDKFISSTKDSLKMAIGECKLDSNNKIPVKNKEICKFAYIISFGKSPDDAIDDKALLETLQTLQNVAKNNEKVHKNNENLTSLGLILKEIGETPNAEKQTKLEANADKLKNIKLTKSELKSGMVVLKEFMENKDNVSIKPILEKIKDGVMDITIKNGFTINNKEDIDFLNENGGKKIEKALTDKKINTESLSKDPKDSLVLKEVDGEIKIEPLINDGKINGNLKDLENINTINIKDSITQIEKKMGGDIGTLLDKLFKNPAAMSALYEIPFIGAIFKFLKALFSPEGQKGKEELKNDEKIKLIQEMLKEEGKGFGVVKDKKDGDLTNIKVNVDNEGKTGPESVANETYIKNVQKITGVTETVKKDYGNEEPKKQADVPNYGKETIKAVKKIQEDMGYGKKGDKNEAKKIDGIFNEDTAKDYVEKLKSEPEAKPEAKPEVNPANVAQVETITIGGSPAKNGEKLGITGDNINFRELSPDGKKMHKTDITLNKGKQQVMLDTSRKTITMNDGKNDFLMIPVIYNEKKGYVPEKYLNVERKEEKQESVKQQESVKE